MNQSRSRAVTDHQYQRQRAHDDMWPFEGVAHQRRAVQQREGKGDIRQRPLRNLVFFDARPKVLSTGVSTACATTAPGGAAALPGRDLAPRGGAAHHAACRSRLLHPYRDGPLIRLRHACGRDRVLSIGHSEPFCTVKDAVVHPLPESKRPSSATRKIEGWPLAICASAN